MAIMAETNLSTPTAYSSPHCMNGSISSRLAANKQVPVFKTGSRILEAKLTSKSLRNGFIERMKHVWPQVKQMTPRIGARAQTGSRNMAVMTEVESSTPRPIRPSLHLRTYCQPFCRKQTTSGFYLRFSKPEVVFRRQNLRSNRLGTGLLSVRSTYGYQ